MRKGGEQALDFVAIQKECWWWRGAFDGNRHNPLSLDQHLGSLRSQIVKEGLDRRQALIARTDVIVALRFQGSQELTDAFGCEILDLYSGDLASTISSDEEQEQPYGVAIAFHCGNAHPLLDLEAVFKERIQQDTQGSCAHGDSPCRPTAAKRSNRTLACSSRSAVMVR